MIYNKLMSLDTAQAGSAHLLKSLFATLLAKSSTPYFTIIHRWLGTPANGRNGIGQDTLLYDQSLQSIDPYHEFFVQATNCTNSAASSQRRQIGYWGVNQATGTPLAKIAAQDGDQYWYQSYQVRYAEFCICHMYLCPKAHYFLSSSIHCDLVSFHMNLR